MATTREKDRPTVRGQWMIKSKLLDEETLDTIRRAAANARMGIGDWATTRLREVALVELGRPLPPPEPPVPIEDAPKALLELGSRHLAELAGLAERLVSTASSPPKVARRPRATSRRPRSS